MNYVKHLNSWMELVDADDRLSAHHISLYLSLFQVWNKSRFPDKIVISRNELFRLSKIGSSKTYYKCLHQLHEFGYIRYYPSNNALKGSAVALVDLSDQDNFERELLGTKSPNSGDDGAPETPKYFCSPTPTQVVLEQNQHRSCGKIDTGSNQAVTPFKINYINVSKGKHRKRGAHAQFHELDEELKKISKGAGERRKWNELDEHHATDPHVASCLHSSMRKNSGWKFFIPSLDQVKTFFASLDSQEISPTVLNHKNLELEAIKFFHHYEANGWLVGGKSPMRNWLSAGLSWLAKAPNFNRNTPSSSRPNHLHVDNDQQYGKPL